MASVYTNDLRLEEIGSGEQSGTWGDTTNTNLELIAEAFAFGTEAITTNADTHATTIADGATDPGRAMFLKYTGSLDSTCTITLGPNTVSKMWFIENATTGSSVDIIIKQGSGATVTIPNGHTKAVYSDGAGSGAVVVDALTDLNVPSLFVKNPGTGDNSTALLTLQTAEADIAANDVLGKISFQAPNEGTGTDAILIAAAIQAISEGDFSSSSNATSLAFMTGASEAAATKMTLSSAGDLTLTSTTASTSSTTGSLIVGGGVGIAADLFVGDDFDVTGDAVIDGTALVTGVLTTTATAVFNGGFTSNGDTATFASGNADDPIIIIKNTRNDAASAGLQFVKDKGAAGADGDDIGQIDFIADNDAQQQTTFVSILSEVSTAADGSEGGKYAVRLATHDGEMQTGLLLQDGNAEDEIDVTIGSGTSSVTTIAGTLTSTGNITSKDISVNSGGGASSVAVSGTGRADLFLIDSGAGTDVKRRTIRSDGGTLTFGMENDAIDSFTSHMSISGAGAATFSGTTSAPANASVSVSRVATQGSLGTSGNGSDGVVLQLNQETTDDSGAWNSSNYRFTALRAGRYLFNWSHPTNINNGGIYRSYLWKNGSQLTDTQLRNDSSASAASYLWASRSKILKLAADDFIELRASSDQNYAFFADSHLRISLDICLAE